MTTCSAKHEEGRTITTATDRCYYYAGTQRVAMRTKVVGETSSALLYLFSDHLGSSSIAAESVNGNLVNEMRYKAWGETRYTYSTNDTQFPTTFRYTGQREADEIGLYYYGARWYDPYL